MNLEKEVELNEQDLRRDAKRRMKQWHKENSTDWEDVAMIVAVAALLAYIIIRSIF
jgi:hypothetical protein